MAEGFHDFAAAEVLTAANTDDYLIRQGIMRFADAAARDTALSGVLVEGLRAYTKDVNRDWIYSGSAWFLLPTINPPRCLAVRTASLTISTSTITAVPLSAADIYDTDTMHDIVTNNSRIVLPFIGVWRVSYGVRFTAALEMHETWVCVNSAGAGTSARLAWDSYIGNATYADLKSGNVEIVTTAATDYVELFVTTTQGGGGGTAGGTAQQHDIWLEAVYAGPVF